jgi:Tfp pilus assembly protein PilN
MIRLNLLPPERLRKLASEATIGRWRLAAWLMTGAAAIVLIGFFILSYGLKARQEKLAADVQKLNAQFDTSDSGAIRRQIKSLNAAGAVFDQALVSNRSWAADMAAILNSLPAKTQLLELVITENGDVTISGVSKVRADFLAFDDAIKKNTLLGNVQTDSTASRRENLPYRYTATLIRP